jgi:NFACT protein C-terminal domain
LNRNGTETAEGASKRRTKEEKAKEALKWRQAMEEEGLVDSDLDEDAVDDTAELLKLTAKPQEEDLLLYAIPVCAPYQTLSQYTYRVKLTPGSMKRGKAAKQCTELFLKANPSSAPGTERQLELIKRVVDNDWVQVICADVKIATPGATKTTKKAKTDTKKKGK